MITVLKSRFLSPTRINPPIAPRGYSFIKNNKSRTKELNILRFGNFLEHNKLLKIRINLHSFFQTKNLLEDLKLEILSKIFH